MYYNTHLGDNFVHACRVEVFASIVVDEKKSIKSYYIPTLTLTKELGSTHVNTPALNIYDDEIPENSTLTTINAMATARVK